MFLGIVRRHLSIGYMPAAVEGMFYATAFAMRGEAELFERDAKAASASEMGKKSAEVRGRLSRRAQPIYDDYLRNAAKKPDDSTKTGAAKRAHRLLLSDCRHFRQSQAGDELASQRVSEHAPAGLLELLLDGWNPPERWQTLYKRLNASKKP